MKVKDLAKMLNGLDPESLVVLCHDRVHPDSLHVYGPVTGCTPGRYVDRTGFSGDLSGVDGDLLDQSNVLTDEAISQGYTQESTDERAVNAIVLWSSL